MKQLVFVLTSLALIAGANAAEKRKPASKHPKKVPALTCSNAAGDSGYMITIFAGSRATVLENNLGGALHRANLNCQTDKNAGPAAPDMRYTSTECTGTGKDGHQYEITVSSGGFAGITTADLDIDGTTVVDNAICHF